MEIEKVILNVAVDNAFREWKEGLRSYGNAAGSLPCKFVSQFISVYSFMSWDPPQFNSVRGTQCVKLVSDVQNGTSLELMLVLVSARSEAWESEKRLMIDGEPRFSLIHILAMWRRARIGKLLPTYQVGN